MHVERVIVLPIPSVRPSNAGFVSKRMHISSHFFDSHEAPSPLQNLKGNPSAGALNTRGGKTLQMSPFISGTVTHGYFGQPIDPVPMTWSDIERRDAKGQTFPEDVRNNASTV